MSYKQMLEHVGHEIELAEYESFHTDEPLTLEIRCREKQCEVEEPIIEIASPK